MMQSSSPSSSSKVEPRRVSAAARVAHTAELLLMILEILQAEQSKNWETLLQCRLVDRFFSVVVSRILAISVFCSVESTTHQLLSHRQLTLADIADLQSKADIVTDVVVDLMSNRNASEILRTFRTLRYPSLRNVSIIGCERFRPPPKAVWKRLLPSQLVGLRIDWIRRYSRGSYLYDNNTTNDIVQVMMKSCPMVKVCSIEWFAVIAMTDELWYELLDYLKKTTSLQRLNFRKARSGMLNNRVENLVSILACKDSLTHLTISPEYHHDGLFTDAAKQYPRPFASLNYLHLDVRSTYLNIFTQFISLVPNVQHLYLTTKAHGWDNIIRLRGVLVDLRTLHLFIHDAGVLPTEIPGHARLMLSYLQKLSTLRVLKVIPRCHREDFHSSFLPLMQEDLQQKPDSVWPNMDRIFLHCPKYVTSYPGSEDPSGDADIWKKKHDGTFDHQRRSMVQYVPEKHYDL